MYSQVWMEVSTREVCGDLKRSSSRVGFGVEEDSKHLVDILQRLKIYTHKHTNKLGIRSGIKFFGRAEH